MDLVELEVVGHFVDLLASPNQRLQFYAITALRNLSTYYGKNNTFFLALLCCQTLLT
jgi:hypothetical protein